MKLYYNKLNDLKEEVSGLQVSGKRFRGKKFRVKFLSGKMLCRENGFGKMGLYHDNTFAKIGCVQSQIFQ